MRFNVFYGLRQVNFAFCGVGDGGFEALAAAMPRLTGLKAVIASGNACGDAGARAMAAAVRGARGLERLDMMKNAAVGAAAAAELRDATKCVFESLRRSVFLKEATATVREYSGPEEDDY